MNERPLENIISNGGMTRIFRTIGCIGDSLSSGEFESRDKSGTPGYHDMFEYSWGQVLARAAGSKAYNFSRGGMTAKEFMESYAEEQDYFNPEKACIAYIVALGVNDCTRYIQKTLELGEIGDIDMEDYKNNKKTFVGYYGAIIQKYKEIQPRAKFFLMTMPRGIDKNRNEQDRLFNEKIRETAELFDNAYLLDFEEYAPVYDAEFRKKYYMGGHMTPAGYVLTADYVGSYIDYIVRNNFEDFAEVGFIGTELHYEKNIG